MLLVTPLFYYLRHANIDVIAAITPLRCHTPLIGISRRFHG